MGQGLCVSLQLRQKPSAQGGKTGGLLAERGGSPSARWPSLSLPGRGLPLPGPCPGGLSSLWP